jgi:hypothetical protein
MSSEKIIAARRLAPCATGSDVCRRPESHQTKRLEPQKFRERNPDFFFLVEVNRKPTTQKN